jgi:hypothetical protein
MLYLDATYATIKHFYLLSMQKDPIFVPVFK